MASLYYRLLYRLDGRDALLIWYSNDRDGVIVHDGCMSSFSSEDALRQFAAQRQLTLVDEVPRLHDLDSVQRWVLCPRGQAMDCATTLAAWNLFSDVACSIPDPGTDFSKIDSEHNDIYEKLFFGNNLPAITPEGAQYDARWSDLEVVALAQILDCGLRFFRSVRRDVTV